MHGAVSFSSNLSPVAWLSCCFVSGICNCPLGSGFCLSGQYACCPLDSSHSPDFVHGQGQENFPVVEIPRVLSVEGLLDVGFLGVDLILPCLTVVLTNTQVLPIDGATCRVQFKAQVQNVWILGPMSPIQ